MILNHSHFSTPQGVEENFFSAVSATEHIDFTGEASALLGALRPYLSPERQSKIDNAINIAKIAKIAKTIIPEFGGDKGV